MPIVKYQSFTKSSHHPSVSARSEYLLRDGRAVLQETLNVGLEGWPEAMDAERRIFGKDDGRLFTEMVLSPEGATAEQTLDISREVAMERFPNAQVAIVVHVDSRERGLAGLEGIPHAHIVVNNVNLETGGKIHLDRDEIRAIHNDVQEIARGMGLSALERYEPGVRLECSQERRRTLEERQIEMSGRECWKETVREMALQAAELSREFDDFERKLAAADVSLEIRNGRVYLVDIDHPGRACRADKLDRSLSAQELGARFMSPDRTDLSPEARARHLAKKLKQEVARRQERRIPPRVLEERREQARERARERERGPERRGPGNARAPEAGKALGKGAEALLELSAPSRGRSPQQAHEPEGVKLKRKRSRGKEGPGREQEHSLER